ncbi:hypothetical protein [Nocardioides sp.]|uniref:hypothetical protein n=1 Tax=Nocardioides sp. TaxID=35761 RepID=UPI002B26A2D2|nr:hypothetical protein [Nocardioides sp.]
MTETQNTYPVVLLVEQQLSSLDATQVRGLHESIEEPVIYHVLLPVDDAAARVEASLGSLSGSEMVGSPAPTLSEVDLEALEQHAQEQARDELAATVAALEAAGATVAGGALVTGHPAAELAKKVSAVNGREAIVLTRPHVVAEFFHVDWASQARRKLGVPVLHLLEHQTFDEQAEGL